MNEKKTVPEIRYYRLAEYNRMRIIDRTGEILEKEHNAKRLYTRFDTPFEIVPRSNYTDPEKDKLQNLPHLFRRGEYLTFYFVMGGKFYHFEIDHNPLFPMMFQKITIDETGNYTGRRYLYSTEDKQYNKYFPVASLCYDIVFRICTEEDIEIISREWIKQILSFAETGIEAEPYSERKRQYCGSRYYYKTIYDRTQCNIYNNQYIERS